MTRPTQPQPPRRLRCAIYTRKSSEEGLDMEFNSLDAQREACEAYIASQKAEGWVCLRDKYDDGGFSGGTLERPALKDLIADIEDGLIDIVVVYKIDRLSRALMDFSKLVEIFDKHGVTFVSVTQSFNTTTSMGRLTLNILLSFAQFEREVIGERIRDKVAASRKKGIWMGGPVPLGYNVKDRKLIVDPAEAETVRTIFTLYARSSSTAEVIRELDARAILTKTGRPYDKTSLLKTLHNKVYRGLAVHKGTAYPGEHDAIIDETLWDEVHEVIANNRVKRVAVAQGTLTGAAARADLHRDRRRDDPAPHQEGHAALSLLRLDGRDQKTAQGRDPRAATVAGWHGRGCRGRRNPPPAAHAGGRRAGVTDPAQGPARPWRGGHQRVAHPV